MDKSTFKNIVQHPDILSSSDLSKLEELIQSFPYCQLGHILMAKLSKKNNSLLAEQHLRKAAAYIADRKVLKQLLSGEGSKSTLTSSGKTKHILSNTKEKSKVESKRK